MREHALTRFRRSRRLTQAALGALLGGVDKSTVSRWEARQRRPEARLWPLIKAVTNGEVSIDDFADDTPEVSQK